MTWESEPRLTTPGRAHNETSKVDGRLDETKTVVKFPGVEHSGKFNFDWAVPTIEGSSEAPSGRGGHSGTLVGGKIFVFGGHFLEGKSFQYSNELFVLDVDNNRWTKPRVKGQVPAGRYNHAACLVHDKIYIFGGKTESACLRDMHTLNVNTYSYDDAPAQIKNTMTLGLPAARHGHSMNLYGTDQLVVFGGTNDKKFFNDVHIYDATTHTWMCASAVAEENSKMTVEGRALHAAVVVGDYLVVHGGIGKAGNYLADVKVFHLKNFVWSRLRTTGIPPSARYAHSLSLSTENSLVLIGGWQGLPYRCELCGAPHARLPEEHREFCTLKKRSITVAEKAGADNAFSLDLHTLTWSPIPNASARYGHSSIAIGPHYVVFGGWDGNKALADVCVLRNNAHK